jgi:RNA ligase (TIGR02306 family)
MSSFDVTCHRVEIAPHPNGDRLDLARVGGYVSCVAKSQGLKTGDLAIYIPEAALLPEPILAELNLLPMDGSPVRHTRPIQPAQRAEKGGSGDRVKAIRLRKVLSQGLIYVPEGIELIEGKDYAEELEITKYEPPIPSSLDGKIEPASGIKPNSDPENVLKRVNVLIEGEEVSITEKLHGSSCVVHFDGARVVVSSKGVAGKGFSLIDEVDEHGRSKNGYWRVAHQYGLTDKLPDVAKREGAQLVTLYGEVFGSGIQDLQYGHAPGKLSFLAFDVRINGDFVSYEEFVRITDEAEIERVPEFYRGPYSAEIVAKHTDGKTTVGGDHIREGVVVRTVAERYDDEVGRVTMKSISGDYLTRNGATEYQ